MVNVVEVVLELQASGFINGTRATRGRVVRAISGGQLTCQVDDEIKGVDVPGGSFDHVDLAREALLRYWAACDVEHGKGRNWQHKS